MVFIAVDYITNSGEFKLLSTALYMVNVYIVYMPVNYLVMVICGWKHLWKCPKICAT